MEKSKGPDPSRSPCRQSVQDRRHVSIPPLSPKVRDEYGASSPLDKYSPCAFDIVTPPVLSYIPESRRKHTPGETPTHETGCDCHLCTSPLHKTVVSGFRKSWQACRKSITSSMSHLVFLPTQPTIAFFFPSSGGSCITS